ncbi:MULTISPECIES: DUF2057 family protein [unclassified Acinetobacter]|uniref:DUF2057 family protein n=1 Tax=unclassified Acinetobacter TaxID=196816 RepID=UPI00190BC8E5|nr:MULTISPECIES: DUF2057 family protein [unclassified Acinetobacter]MBK0062218.1 DUF2057 family protein [Acinetobacter sp. S55]MBK0066022.1 DUF2057 family protein [Acinetobacter sp. S54]
MTLKFTLAALSLCLSSSVFAAATITAPEEIVILAVNDQEVNSGLLRQKENAYKVDAGEISISVRYQEFFQHLDGEHDIVKSGIVTLKTPPLKDGASYKLDLLNAPANFEDAKKYAEQPTIGLYNASHQLLVRQTGANTEAKPWFNRGLFGKAYDLTQNKSAPANQPAPVYTAQAATVKETVDIPSTIVTTQTVSAGKTHDQQLVELWQKSSKVERQKFMAWLAGQTN